MVVDRPSADPALMGRLSKGFRNAQKVDCHRGHDGCCYGCGAACRSGSTGTAFGLAEVLLLPLHLLSARFSEAEDLRSSVLQI